MDQPVIESPSPDAGCGAGRCGATARQMDGMSEAIRAKVQDHPCFSEDAHHHFARMHVAVAPACNIQCHRTTWDRPRFSKPLIGFDGRAS